MRTHFFFAALLPAGLAAQPVITSADCAQGGTTYPFVNTTIVDAGAVDVSGANVVWDFSDLYPTGDAPVTPSPISAASFTAQLVFNSPFNGAYQSSFFLPTELPDLSDIAALPIPLDGFNSFYKTSGSAFAICGIGLSSSGFDLPVEYSDVDELLPLPCTYGSTLNSTGAFDLTIDGVFGYSSTLARTIEADAWGTLILPDGPHEVVRVRTEISGTDVIDIPQIGFPIEIPRTDVIYQWWGDNHGFPLLEVTTLFGFPVTSRYQALPAANSVHETAATPTPLVAPNPVETGRDCRYLGTPGPWSLLDGAGRVLAQGEGMHLPTSELPAGIYVVRSGSSSTRIVIR
jgi:hypothetical protein